MIKRSSSWFCKFAFVRVNSWLKCFDLRSSARSAAKCCCGAWLLTSQSVYSNLSSVSGPRSHGCPSHAAKFLTGGPSCGLDGHTLYHGDKEACQFGGIAIARQVTGRFGPPQALAQFCFSLVTTRDKFMTNVFCVVSANQRTLDSEASPRTPWRCQRL